jgi:hypothetical protein
MAGKQVSVEELKQVLAADFDQLVQEVAKAMNAAQGGPHHCRHGGTRSPGECRVSRTTVREGDPPLAEPAGGFFPLGRKDCGTKARSRPVI